MHAFIGLGANLGDRLATLLGAQAALGRLGAVLARSPIYATDPVGGPPQPEYLNAAALLSAPLSPLALLSALGEIERAAGRVRTGERDAPRTLDLDLLLLGADGELIVELPALSVPHPRLHLRAFALRPLLDLRPDLVHPVLRRPLGQIYAELLQSGPSPRLLPATAPTQAT